MKLPTCSTVRRWFTVTIAVATVFTFLAPLISHGAPPLLVDDFADMHRHGSERPLITDKDLGSKSQARQTCAAGVLKVEGELVPGRGVPAFITLPLLLNADFTPKDLSAYEGVRLRVKVNKGIVTVQVASADIDNFDYHTSGPVVAKPGEFHDVRIPFKDLKRGWSEQIALNLKTITSVNLVAFGLAKDSFAYEVDEIGFY